MNVGCQRRSIRPISYCCELCYVLFLIYLFFKNFETYPRIGGFGGNAVSYRSHTDTHIRIRVTYHFLNG